MYDFTLAISCCVKNQIFQANSSSILMSPLFKVVTYLFLLNEYDVYKNTNFLRFKLKVLILISQWSLFIFFVFFCLKRLMLNTSAIVMFLKHVIKHCYILFDYTGNVHGDWQRNNIYLQHCVNNQLQFRQSQHV